MLPLRWYMAVLFGQAARGLPTYASAKPFAILAGLAILYALLALWRLRAISKRVGDRAPPEEEAISPAAPGVGAVFTAEWKRVLANRGALAMMVSRTGHLWPRSPTTLSDPNPAQGSDRCRR